LLKLNIHSAGLFVRSKAVQNRFAIATFLKVILGTIHLFCQILVKSIKFNVLSVLNFLMLTPLV